MSDHASRSAETGQFVTDEEAAENPATTVRESAPHPHRQVPSVGRVVHYVSYGTPGGEYSSQCRAAIITAVNKPDSLDPSGVSLAVLNPTGLFFDQGLPFSEEHRGGTWHWPERV